MTLKYITTQVSDVDTILAKITKGEYRFNPAYQRAELRWSPKERENFINHICIRRFSKDAIVLYKNETGIYEIVDGLQRIGALLEAKSKTDNFKSMKIGDIPVNTLLIDGTMQEVVEYFIEINLFRGKSLTVDEIRKSKAVVDENVQYSIELANHLYIKGSPLFINSKQEMDTKQSVAFMEVFLSCHHQINPDMNARNFTYARDMRKLDLSHLDKSKQAEYVTVINRCKEYITSLSNLISFNQDIKQSPRSLLIFVLLWDRIVTKGHLQHFNVSKSRPLIIQAWESMQQFRKKNTITLNSTSRIKELLQDISGSDVDIFN